MNPYPTGTPNPNYPDCDYGHDGEPGDDCEMPGFEDPENEEGGVGSFPQNTCYVDNVETDCNAILANPTLYGLNSDEGSSGEIRKGDTPPSEEGPQGIFQDDDQSDDNSSSEAGERDFEVEYSGMEANIKGNIAAGDIVDNSYRVISVWDLRTMTLPDDKKTPEEQITDAISAANDLTKNSKCANAIEGLLKEAAIRKAKEDRKKLGLTGDFSKDDTEALDSFIKTLTAQKVVKVVEELFSKEDTRVIEPANLKLENNDGHSSAQIFYDNGVKKVGFTPVSFIL